MWERHERRQAEKGTRGRDKKQSRQQTLSDMPWNVNSSRRLVFLPLLVEQETKSQKGEATSLQSYHQQGQYENSVSSDPEGHSSITHNISLELTA